MYVLQKSLGLSKSKWLFRFHSENADVYPHYLAKQSLILIRSTIITDPFDYTE
jgi:hypothetical protein